MPGEGPVRTGVTAVSRGDGDPFLDRVFAASYVLNGAGEADWACPRSTSGASARRPSCSPTRSASGASPTRPSPGYGAEPADRPGFRRRHPGVAECDDSFLNDAVGRHVSETDVWAALDGARRPVAEGSVGAGTGMQSFHFAGGIGTSREVELAGEFDLVGALVLSNFGDREQLRIDGVPVGRLLADAFRTYRGGRPPDRSSCSSPPTYPVPPAAHASPGAPRSPSAGRAGTRRTTREDGLHIDETPNPGASPPQEHGAPAPAAAPRAPPPPGRHVVELVLDTGIDPLYEATVDVVEEAILNAIFGGADMTGHSGHHAPALPLTPWPRSLKAVPPPPPLRPSPSSSPRSLCHRPRRAAVTRTGDGPKSAFSARKRTQVR